MPQPRLIAILTALVLLSGGSKVLADYSLDQLVEIDRLISVKDFAALYAFLKANPIILAGSDPLAVELRQFVASVEQGQLTGFDETIFSDRAGRAAQPTAPGVAAPAAPAQPY